MLAIFKSRVSNLAGFAVNAICYILLVRKNNLLSIKTD